MTQLVPSWLINDLQLGSFSFWEMNFPIPECGWSLWHFRLWPQTNHIPSPDSSFLSTSPSFQPELVLFAFHLNICAVSSTIPRQSKHELKSRCYQLHASRSPKEPSTLFDASMPLQTSTFTEEMCSTAPLSTEYQHSRLQLQCTTATAISKTDYAKVSMKYSTSWNFEILYTASVVKLLIIIRGVARVLRAIRRPLLYLLLSGVLYSIYNLVRDVINWIISLVDGWPIL